MIRRALLIPIRLMLGLPPIYGLTIKCRVLMLLRKAGVYRGTIDFVAKVKPIHIGMTGQSAGKRA